MNRDNFSILKSGIIYFDSGATSLKPNCLIESTTNYYTKYSANTHRGDYDISIEVDHLYEHTRELVKELLNAKSINEIIYTSGTTDSLNRIIFGYFKHHLISGDEVLLTKSEHASLILPWFELADELALTINYIPLNDNLKITMEALKASITPKTKVISVAHITNVVGDLRPLADIIKYAHEHHILVLVDGAQSVAHIPVDVQALDIDFLAFSAHKMLGPTGVGILYGKEKLLKEMRPMSFGGGMNASFSANGTREYDDLPSLLEAGTPNIAGILGFGATLAYLMKIGLNKINTHEVMLRKYAIERLQEIPEITIYNEISEAGIITINYQDIFAQDLAIYLNKYHICVRAGNHCAKMLQDELGIKNTCRISFYLYNTTAEIDQLITVLKNPKIKEEII